MTGIARRAGPPPAARRRVRARAASGCGSSASGAAVQREIDRLQRARRTRRRHRPARGSRRRRAARRHRIGSCARAGLTELPWSEEDALSIEEKYDEVRQLITIGKEKGYLLYDEVNELLPSDITSSDELDDLFSTFGSAGHRGRRLRPEVPRRQASTARRRRRGARARPDAGRARQDQRPGPHVPARDGHRAAAHARGRGRDRASASSAASSRSSSRSRARRSSRKKVIAAGRAAQGRRAHHPRAGDLQRRGDHRRAHRGAHARGPASRSRRSARRAQVVREGSRRSSTTIAEDGQAEVPPRALEGDARAAIELSRLHPQDRVHRDRSSAA